MLTFMLLLLGLFPTVGSTAINAVSNYSTYDAPASADSSGCAIKIRSAQKNNITIHFRIIVPRADNTLTYGPERMLNPHQGRIIGVGNDTFCPEHVVVFVTDNCRDITPRVGMVRPGDTLKIEKRDKCCHCKC